MKVATNELNFISRIKRDGSGVEQVSEIQKEAFTECKQKVQIIRLSLSQKTFITRNLFNTYVVSLKIK